MHKTLIHRLTHCWLFTLAVALLGLHLSGTNILASEPGLSASPHGSAAMVMINHLDTAPAKGEHTSMEDGPGHGKCCAAADHCGPSCSIMTFNGQDVASLPPSFPPLRTPLRIAMIEGQTPLPLFRPPIIFS